MNTQIYTKLISDFYITIFLLFEKLNSQEYSLYFDYFLSMIVYVRYVHWSTVLIKIKYISWSVSDWLVVYIYLVPQGSARNVLTISIISTHANCKQKCISCVVLLLRLGLIHVHIMFHAISLIILRHDKDPKYIQFNQSPDNLQHEKTY